jgi:hypothetical protein
LITITEEKVYVQVIRVGIVNYLGYSRRIGAEIERLSYINPKWTPVNISLSIVGPLSRPVASKDVLFRDKLFNRF